MSLDLIDELRTEKNIRDPIFRALDELREALDISLEQGNERISGLLLLTIRDLADTVDLTRKDK